MTNEQIFEYAREGNLIKLGQVVARADVGVTDADGLTPLMHAAANNRYAVAGLLVGTDASSIDAQDSRGRTALMHACSAGGRKIVKMLLKKGADASLTDSNGKTARDHAEAGGHAKCLKHLSKLG